MKMVHIYVQAELFFWTAYLIVFRRISLSSAAYTWVSKVHCMESTHIQVCWHFYRIKKKERIIIWNSGEESAFFAVAKKLWMTILKERSSAKQIKHPHIPSLLAVIFILVNACGDNQKTLVLRCSTVQRTEQVRITCQIYAAVTCQLINKVQEEWLTFMKKFHTMRN
jgi:hypothetical protein